MQYNPQKINQKSESHMDKKVGALNIADYYILYGKESILKHIYILNDPHSRGYKDCQQIASKIRKQ